MLVLGTVALASLFALAPEGPDDIYEPPMLEIGGPPPCDFDVDCRWEERPFCHPDTQQCSECLGDEHCDEGWSCNPVGTCVDACETDEDCEGVNDQDTCDPATNSCVQCVTSDDCEAAEYCMESYCYNDHCEPGELICVGNTLMECLEDGGSISKYEECFPKCIYNEKGDDECQAKGGDDGFDTGDDGFPPATSGGEPTTGVHPTGGSMDGTTLPQGDPMSSVTSDSGDAGGVSGRGCSCRSDGDTPAAPWGGLGLVVLLALRRRRH
ncbi:MAG: MYXO-CTERM sorting domain-containing protein [Myxococcota bacterium]